MGRLVLDSEVKDDDTHTQQLLYLSFLHLPPPRPTPFLPSCLPLSRAVLPVSSSSSSFPAQFLSSILPTVIASMYPLPSSFVSSQTSLFLRPFPLFPPLFPPRRVPAFPSLHGRPSPSLVPSSAPCPAFPSGQTCVQDKYKHRQEREEHRRGGRWEATPRQLHETLWWYK